MTDTAKRPIYSAEADHHDGWWIIDVPELKGVHTQAKRLDRVEHMARDAIALMLDVPEDSFDVDVHPHLSADVEDALRRLAKARQELTDAQISFTTTAVQVAQLLVRKCGLTVRDAGRIIGVSHQRVDQLLNR